MLNNRSLYSLFLSSYVQVVVMTLSKGILMPYLAYTSAEKVNVWIELDGAGSCIYYDVSANILMHVCGVSAS